MTSNQPTQRKQWRTEDGVVRIPHWQPQVLSSRDVAIMSCNCVHYFYLVQRILSQLLFHMASKNQRLFHAALHNFLVYKAPRLQ